MSYLLDGVRGGYPSWRNYFDIIVVSAGQAGVLHRGAPVRRARRRRRSRWRKTVGRAVPARPRLPGRQPQDVPAAGRARSGDHVLYIGDHIYGDMLRVAEVVELAHGDGAAGAGARDHGVRPAAARAGAPRPARRRAHPPRLRAERAPGGDALAAEAGRPSGRRRRRQPRRSARSRTRSRSCARELRDDRGPAPHASRARSTTPSTRTGARCSARATRSASSASRSRPTPASTRAASRTSASTRRCSTSAARATACRTNADGRSRGRSASRRKRFEQRRRFLQRAARARRRSRRRRRRRSARSALIATSDGAGAGQQLEPRRRQPDRRRPSRAAATRIFANGDEQLARERSRESGCSNANTSTRDVHQRGDRRPDRQPDVAEAAEGQRCSRSGSRPPPTRWRSAARACGRARRTPGATTLIAA